MEKGEGMLRQAQQPVLREAQQPVLQQAQRAEFMGVEPEASTIILSEAKMDSAINPKPETRNPKPVLRQAQQPDLERWLVVYTKSRQEKKTEERLLEIGIEAYCPMMIKERKWSDRIKKVAFPIFSCYCFVKVKPSQERKVVELDCVSRFVYWQGRPAVVKDKEIEYLQLWLNDTDTTETITVPLEINDRAIIKSGSLMGKEGVIMHKSGNQVTLWIEELGIKVISTLKRVMIEKL
jgi:transcriptional antiterminator RfaH